MTTHIESIVRGSEKRHAEHAIDEIFLNRWSPRAMSGEEISEEELMVLFEAARWAPSSYNNQPWRMLYARRSSKHWDTFLDLLVEGNRVWAKNAAVLVVFISKTTFDYNGKISITHSFDAGAAWENLALQGSLKGYVVHGMEGFDFQKAKSKLQIPDDFNIEAMAAIGRPGKKEDLPQKLQETESPSQRRNLEQTVCEGPFCL
jgi:nitroreductase